MACLPGSTTSARDRSFCWRRRRALRRGIRRGSIALRALAGRTRAQVQRLGIALAENLLHDYPVYTVKPKDLESARQWGYEPGALRVVPGAVQLQLEPIRR